MGYLFGAVTTNRIDCGAVATAATWSMYLSLKLTGSPATIRRLMTLGRTDTEQYTMFLQAEFATNNLKLGFTYNAAANWAEDTVWASALTAGTIYRIIGTYDGTTVKLYADTDATPKATQAVTATPDVAGVAMCIGNRLNNGFSVSADATIYEAVWAPAVVWTGAQAAALGAGNASGITLPTNYWDLIADPYDMFGGKNGVVTGATVVAHTGRNLWPLASIWQPLSQRSPVLAQ